MNDTRIQSLVRLRHYLHAHPELSGKEENTNHFIHTYFQDLKPDRIRKIAGTGLMVTFKSRKSKKNVMVRAELDALPIHETNSFQYKSVNEGISHKCGHDGHMAMMIGVGDWCATRPLKQTNVHLLFQPAEETGQGAKVVLEDPEFDVKPDFCFALHNIPGFEVNEILIRKDLFSASVISISIELTGNTSHAADPQSGVNPALAVAEIIHVFDKLNQSGSSKDDFFICTPIYIKMGEEAFGTSAGKARLGFTFRSWSNDRMKETQAAVKGIIQEIADLNKLGLKYQWLEEFYANYNHSEAVDLAVRSAKIMNYSIRHLEQPFRWGEDFGLFTNQFKGAMIGIGAGKDTPALHHQQYDFPDEILETGTELLKEILKQVDGQ
jgi:amidohydrolase